MSKNWYPVINTETCTECGACVQKCGHGVYDRKSAMKPVIVNADGCVEGCHGCGNLCPSGSITYVGENTAWKPPKPEQVKKEQAEKEAEAGCGPGCSCSEDAADAELPVKDLDIDFLYLDLQTCKRCMSTDETLKEALDLMSGTFDALGYRVKLNSVNITTKELAEKYQFVSSPTIRVNGVDICSELVESDCADCGSLCGGSVDCRVFVWEGKGYEQPPVAMIVDGILRVLYGNVKKTEAPYAVPENLIKFFAGRKTTMKKMQIYEPAMCCPTGLCGVSIDPELLRISTVLDTLKKNGITVDRYNLTSFPQEFVKNTKINERLSDEGVEALPIIVVDGKVVITKRYPTNDEFIKLLELSDGILGKSGNTKKTSGSDCGCGETVQAEASAGCCGPARGPAKKGCC